MSLIIRVGVLFVAVSGCSAGATDVSGWLTTAGKPTTTVGGAPNGRTVTWCSAFAVFKARCFACHGAPGSNSTTKLGDYLNCKTAAPYVAAAVQQNTMPPPTAQPLADSEKQILLDWAAQSKKDEGGTNCP